MLARRRKNRRKSDMAAAATAPIYDLQSVHAGNARAGIRNRIAAMPLGNFEFLIRVSRESGLDNLGIGLVDFVGAVQSKVDAPPSEPELLQHLTQGALGHGAVAFVPFVALRLRSGDAQRVADARTLLEH